MEQVAGWLVTALIFAFQMAFFYAVGRLIFLGRPVFNPFKKGWSSLREQYGVATPPAHMQSTSALIGSITYKNLLEIRLDTQGLYLGKSFLGKSYVYIPYHAVEVVVPPRRVTILYIPLVLDGLFRAGGVDISFKSDQAKELIEVMARYAMQAGGSVLL